jgi:anthraniloyl-CoA monooxygenase
VKCANWSHFNGNSHVVLMGDAVHTAHFAIGSGTKLALEDAIELVRQFKTMGDTVDRIPEVLKQYQAVREIDVIRLQNAAWNAMEWFEVCGERYCDQLEPEQFMYSMLTRSQRISHENLRLRDKTWLEGYEAWFAARTDTPGVRPPMFTPYTQRSVTLKNRVVVSPMAQYMAHDGRVGDDHLVHLGARAMGGAGLVMVEMTAPSADARITHMAVLASGMRHKPPISNASPTGCTKKQTPKSACNWATPVPKAQAAGPGKVQAWTSLSPLMTLKATGH